MNKFMVRAFPTRSSLEDPFDVGPDDLVPHQEMLSRLVSFVKTNRLKVQSPDYTSTRFYAPQWKIIGNKYYWKSPGASGKVIAVFNSKTKQAWYRESGFNKTFKGPV